jgi:hypothetical protein
MRRLGDPRRQPVVVAEADFGGGDRIILVDHRHRAGAEQPAERRGGVEIAAAVLEVLERQQQLRRGQAVLTEQLAPQAG